MEVWIEHRQLSGRERGRPFREREASGGGGGKCARGLGGLFFNQAPTLEPEISSIDFSLASVGIGSSACFARERPLYLLRDLIACDLLGPEHEPQIDWPAHRRPRSRTSSGPIDRFART